MLRIAREMNSGEPCQQRLGGTERAVNEGERSEHRPTDTSSRATPYRHQQVGHRCRPPALLAHCIDECDEARDRPVYGDD